jgi:hypothetical protein
MSSCSGDFDRAFDVLLTVNLTKIIVDLAGSETGLPGDRFE